jgi:acyl-CoA synthetase (AMP-forming)/AMP-acid ligase II
MADVDAASLRAIVARHGPAVSFLDRDAALCMRELACGTSLGGCVPALAGRSVLLATASQLTSALALIELQGLARRIVILPPDADPTHLAAVIAAAGVDAAVIDEGTPAHRAFDGLALVACSPLIAPLIDALPPSVPTEWMMLTSGTTGVPKMVRHDLGTLRSALVAPSPADGADVWGTFYDIRRYGGL